MQKGISEVSPGAAGGGVCLVPCSGSQLPQVEVSPLGDLCWSLLWSRGTSARFGSGWLCHLAASTTPCGGPRDVTAGPAPARESPYPAKHLKMQHIQSRIAVRGGNAKGEV